MSRNKFFTDPDDRYGLLTLVVAAVMFFGSCSFVMYADVSNDPRVDWAAPKGGWCCAKPRRWCEPSNVCITGGTAANNPCRQWVQGEHCEDLCDEWKREPGGRGKACR
jgi:hypothetical protein